MSICLLRREATCPPCEGFTTETNLGQTKQVGGPFLFWNLRRASPCKNLSFELLASKMERICFCHLKHSRQPQESFTSLGSQSTGPDLTGCGGPRSKSIPQSLAASPCLTQTRWALVLTGPWSPHRRLFSAATALLTLRFFRGRLCGFSGWKKRFK